jgi:hypothetical protein
MPFGTLRIAKPLSAIENLKIGTKYYWIAIVSIMIVSCSQNVQRTVVQLTGELGSISLVLPSSYDTIHDWKSGDDTQCLTKHYYRMQSGKYSLEEESGFYKRMPDVINTLTLKHSEHSDCHFEDSPDARPDLILENRKKHIIAEYEGVPNKLDTIFIDKMFLCYFIDQSNTIDVDPNYFYTALTYHKGAMIEFEFANRGIRMTKEDFMDNCDEILETVKLN